MYLIGAEWLRIEQNLDKKILVDSSTLLEDITSDQSQLSNSLVNILWSKFLKDLFWSPFFGMIFALEWRIKLVRSCELAPHGMTETLEHLPDLFEYMWSKTDW